WEPPARARGLLRPGTVEPRPARLGARRVPVLRCPGLRLGRARGRPAVAGVPSLRRRLVLSAHEVPVLRERAQPGPAAPRAGEPRSGLPDHPLWRPPG